MKSIAFHLMSASLALAVGLPVATASHLTADMKSGKPTFKSMGPISFGPEGILFIADSRSAAITAIATDDTKAKDSAAALRVEGVAQKIAGLLGTSADQILIDDLAVNPLSHQVYLAVSRGRGPSAEPVLLRVKGDGNIETVSLDSVKFSRAELPDAPVEAVVGDNVRRSNPRLESITDIAFLEDRVLLAGLSNEEFSSTLRAIPFPFKTVGKGTSVEIYHGAHGKFETRSPIRTFVPFKVGNEPQLLAAYTCTPLVQFPLQALTPGAKIKGKTIAELGNRNRPLDMIVYQKGGKDYLLMANSSRGIMKIGTDQIEKSESITDPVTGGGSKGLPYETIENWKGIDQLDRLDAGHALVLRRAEGGSLSLESLFLFRELRELVGELHPVRALGALDVNRWLDRPARYRAGRFAFCSNPALAARDAQNTNRVSVEVADLPREMVTLLNREEPRQRQELLVVRMESSGLFGEVGIPAMVGRYSVTEEGLRFEPAFPLEFGIRYRAVWDPRRLPGVSTANARVVSSIFELPSRSKEATTFITTIYPAALELPENLLKFYVHFSSSMSRGHIYEHIHLQDSDGKNVELPFLEIDEELWDPALTRLTLFIDPGRIKREVRPLEEIGPSLVAGRRYTLLIDRAMNDAAGNPLRESFRKSFLVTPPDRQPPDPRRWNVQAPPAGTQTPLRVVFDEPMDHALALRMIRVKDALGEFIEGVANLESADSQWTFTPARRWSGGNYQLLIQTTIEDLAGNNIGKPFEVDLFENVQTKLTNAIATVAFAIN